MGTPANGNARRAAERHFLAALDRFAAGEQEAAIAEYQLALTSDPSFTDAMHGLVRVYQDLEQIDNAITVAQRISATDPEDVLAHTSLSILYQKKGMVSEAEAEANKARILGWKQQLRVQKKPLTG
ncbi:MAG TPA: tetratricopeptide repeat protein [Terriglobales bacterium]|nr:tetratricopeptide repeat protein [Terriglobales bacterium]